ncbi:MAG: hypothetical protein AMXMBFR7_32940 [Planctomycetota bacterium]
MAGENDIKAGGAFVEIGARLTSLQKALGQGTTMLRAWVTDAAGMAKTIGTGLAAGGAAILAPLALGSKTLATFGNEMANLRAQTGLSLETLGALKVAAENSSLSLRGVIGAVAQMQRGLAAPTKDQNTALAALGLDAKSLLALRPEQQLAAIADALLKVENPAQRTQIAMKAFGRGALELLPIIESGSGAITEAAGQAYKFGQVLDEQTLQSALRMDNALNGVGHAFTAVKLAIGQAMVPFIPAVERFTDLIARAAQWVKLNPQVVESFAKIGVTLLAVGTGLVVVGTSIMALMSPALVAASILMGIGLAALAVTDALGVTKLGFLDLFNSVRIDGTGLGTWIVAFAYMIGEAFMDSVSWIRQLWGDLWTGLKVMGLSIFNDLMWIPQKLAEGWDWYAEKVRGVMNGIIEGWNRVAKTVGMGEISLIAKIPDHLNPAKLLKGMREGLAQDSDDALGSNERARAKEQKDRREREAKFKKLNADLFAADPQDGTTGFSVDLERAKGALENVGANIWNGITGALENMVGGIEGLLPQAPEGGAGGGGLGFATAGDAALSKPEFSVAGTFSGAAAQGLAAAGLANRHFEEAKKSNQLLQRIAEQTEDLDMGLA